VSGKPFWAPAQRGGGDPPEYGTYLALEKCGVLGLRSARDIVAACLEHFGGLAPSVEPKRRMTGRRRSTGPPVPAALRTRGVRMMERHASSSDAFARRTRRQPGRRRPRAPAAARRWVSPTRTTSSPKPGFLFRCYSHVDLGGRGSSEQTTSPPLLPEGHLLAVGESVRGSAVWLGAVWHRVRTSDE
jgi:hypothetical protein